MGFSNRLKEYRNKRGLTQQELAEKSDVSRATIVGIENGGVKVVKTDTLMKLSNALGYPVTRIFLVQSFFLWDERCVTGQWRLMSMSFKKKYSSSG